MEKPVLQISTNHLGLVNLLKNTFQIQDADWSNEVKSYFFISWIIGTISDGRQIYNICRVYGQRLTELLRDLIRRCTSVQVLLEFIGLLTSCVAMVKLSWDFYDGFPYLHVRIVYTMFVLAVFFKTVRRFFQGTYKCM